MKSQNIREKLSSSASVHESQIEFHWHSFIVLVQIASSIHIVSELNIQLLVYQSNDDLTELSYP